jgi:oligoribonuclease (3'-5' exoribonuclease)
MFSPFVGRYLPYYSSYLSYTKIDVCKLRNNPEVLQRPFNLICLHEEFLEKID